MGKTGDAEFSPAHLHFEIHPVSLLARGYDGAVAPYPFLNAWRRAQDVSFDAGRAYLPLDGPASARTGVAPPAGAVLLEADDISSASGLVPGALEATLAGRAHEEPDRRSLASRRATASSRPTSTSTASAAASAAPFAVADALFSNSSVSGDVEAVERLQVVVARDLVHQPRRASAGPDQGL